MRNNASARCPLTAEVHHRRRSLLEQLTNWIGDPRLKTTVSSLMMEKTQSFSLIRTKVRERISFYIKRTVREPEKQSEAILI